MKKTLLLVFAAAVAFASCTSHRSDILTLEQRNGEKYNVAIFPNVDDVTGKDVIDTFVEHRHYAISWPLGDHPLLQQSIMYNAFYPDTVNFHDAASRFLEDTYYDVIPKPANPNYKGGAFHAIDVTCKEQPPIYSFEIAVGVHDYGSPGWEQEITYINYDIREKKILVLADLMDTNVVESIVELALKEISSNKETVENMAISELDELENWYDFTVDIEKGEIKLINFTPPHHKAGLWVHLPVKWLMKQGVKLTPYCKDLFGIK